MFSRYYRITIILVIIIAAGCTPILIRQMDELYGHDNPARYNQQQLATPEQPEYYRDIKPILEQRCVVCHGCYDAPCQLNLTSWDGIVRGANKQQVYANRILAASPTRLYIDAQYPSEWREKDFFPVLNERKNTIEANLDGSVLFRLLDLKRRHPLPEQNVLDSKQFDFSLNRKQECPIIEKMDDFERNYPNSGMPYGLPGLSSDEYIKIKEWLAAGAPVNKTPNLQKDLITDINSWEEFLNGRSNKQKLVSRYIYEHLFLAHIYFNNESPQINTQYHFFKLVRSYTPPGQPIKEIPTRKPYDDPGTTQFWYRLRADYGSVIEKTHMPYALDQSRMNNWKKWFINEDYKVNILPDYKPETTSNPFQTFEALPVKSRYRFLLDEAHFVIESFIKGPVCRGQIALGVIDEHFWVYFIDPDHASIEDGDEFLSREAKRLRLPSEDESNVILAWLEYSKLQKEYLREKIKAVKQINRRPDITMVWNGTPNNDNVALTIFRHTDSATVVKGLVGQPPKTSWVLGYALLERIHYLLVASFDIYGNVGHQLTTRLYMDFLRMEAESNFLSLLPQDNRNHVRDYWYRDANDNVKKYLYDSYSDYTIDTGINYHSNNPQAELYQMLRTRVSKHVSTQYDLEKIPDINLRTALYQIQNIHGEALEWFPQIAILKIELPGGQSTYVTLVNNMGYSNISELFNSEKRKKPSEDYLTVVPGIIGAYPNAFFEVNMNDLERFGEQIEHLHTEHDYATLLSKFGIRRTSPKFWSFSDTLMADYRKAEPVNGGILDYNRFENR